jgi:hypothetical protein
VAYTLQLTEDVRAYLRNLPGLSRSGRVALWAGVFDGLRHYADTYRADPSRRLAPDSPRFLCEHILRDPETGRLHSIRLVVNDAGAAYGVLVVEYVDHQAGPADGL